MNEQSRPRWPVRSSGNRSSRAPFGDRPILSDQPVVSERPVFGERPVTEVGNIGPGSAASQAVLRRYLLVRALGSSLINALQWTGIAILVLAMASWLGHFKVLAVLLGLLALVVLAARGMLSALASRLSGARRLGPLEPRVAALVAHTRRGLRRELRRVGLPGSPWAPLFIAWRLARPVPRARTAQALSRIDLANVVPASKVDELQILLRQAPTGRF